MVYGTYNYSYWGESKPTSNWGASQYMELYSLVRWGHYDPTWKSLPTNQYWRDDLAVQPISKFDQKVALDVGFSRPKNDRDAIEQKRPNNNFLLIRFMKSP